MEKTNVNNAKFFMVVAASILSVVIAAFILSKLM